MTRRAESFVHRASTTFPNAIVDLPPHPAGTSLAEAWAGGCQIVRLSAPGVAVDLSGRLARERGLEGWVKIVWQSSGGACLRTATSDSRLRSGDVVVLPLDRSYRFEADEEHDALFLILDASSRPFWRGLADMRPAEPVERGSALAAAGAGIASLMRCAVGGREDVVTLEACLDLAARSLGERVTGGTAELPLHHQLRKATLLVERNIADPGFDPVALAEAMGRSRRSLYKDFERLGMTPARFILKVRLGRARREILAGRVGGGGLTRVAADCGFSDGAAFSHAFRRAYGMAPSALLRHGGGPSASVPQQDPARNGHAPARGGTEREAAPPDPG